MMLAVVLVTTAVVLAVSGGFRTTVGGFRLSARSPVAATITAFLAGGAWWLLARKNGSVAADLGAAWHALERNAPRIIGGIALIAAIVSSVFATRSAAGADASGYLSQAAMWAEGRPAHTELLAEDFRPLDGWVTTPLGWRPLEQTGTIDFLPGAQAPTYPPGLPLLMALPHAFAGIDGASAVVIASAAIATWATGMIAGGVAGVVAATFLAFSPVFLYQSIQPMSDVAVTAAWLLCFLLLTRDRRSVWAGVACASAILIRPNLAPLAIVPFIASRSKRWFTIPVVVAGAVLAVLHHVWYGSPLRSGYGTAEELFSMANVVPNVGRYATWLVTTSPVLVLAPLGFARVRREPLAKALMVFALLVMVSYLSYAVFDHWSFLRFLLPALAVCAVFAAIELTAWIERWPAAIRFPIVFALALGVVAHGLFVARSFDTFKGERTIPAEVPECRACRAGLAADARGRVVASDARLEPCGSLPVPDWSAHQYHSDSLMPTRAQSRPSKRTGC